MPRGTNISRSDRMGWLEAYEDGKRYDTIARERNRSVRTFRDNIDRAREERDQRAVRVEMRLDAQRRHTEDLLGVVEDIRKAVRSAPLPPNHAGEVRAALLLEALNDHLRPRAPLLKARKTLERATQDRDSVCSEIKRQLSELTDARLDELSRRLGDAADALFRVKFTESLDVAVGEIAKGMDPARRTYIRMEVVTKRDEPALTLGWGEFPLVISVDRCDTERLTEVEAVHKELWARISGGEFAVKLSEARRSWQQAQATVERESEVLLLRRLLPGRCELCPS